MNMRYLFCLIIALWGLVSCNSEEDKTYYFIGDQMLDNMDLDAAFPTKHVVDCAVSGRHLKDLMDEPMTVPSDAVAVVLLGMHDIGAGEESASRLPDYCAAFEQMVCHLGAGRVIVVGLLPTKNASRNANYRTFNKEMKQRFAAHENIELVDATYSLVDIDTDLLDDQYARFDGQLLNDYGYQVLAEVIKKKL